jgi:hypothetical protein
MAIIGSLKILAQQMELGLIEPEFQHQQFFDLALNSALVEPAWN